MQVKPPSDPDTRRLYTALAIASGRHEDWFAPLWELPYVADTLAMLRGEREPDDDRERKALAYYRRSPVGVTAPPVDLLKL
jgi:hypothetical protein